MLRIRVCRLHFNSEKSFPLQTQSLQLLRAALANVVRYLAAIHIPRVVHHLVSF